MQRPRELLNAHHAAAEPRLDALRRAVIAGHLPRPSSVSSAWWMQVWHEVFVAPHTQSTGHDEPFAPQIPNNVTVGTQLVLLALSTRLLNTLDRLNLVTVGD